MLLYTDPLKAIAWAARARRAQDAISRHDFGVLLASARESGASLVIVDHLVWQEPIRATAAFQNARFAAYIP